MEFIFFVMAAVGLMMVLNALSTIIKYSQLAKEPPPERPWRDRIREPRII